MVFLVGPVGQEGLDTRDSTERKEADTHTAPWAGNGSFNLSLFARAQKGLPVVTEERQWERERKR